MVRFKILSVALRCAFQVFQVTVQVPNGTFFFIVSMAFRCAFQMFQVTVQVPHGTFLNSFRGFQVFGESGSYNTINGPPAVPPVASGGIYRISIRHLSQPGARKNTSGLKTRALSSYARTHELDLSSCYCTRCGTIHVVKHHVHVQVGLMSRWLLALRGRSWHGCGGLL